MKQRRSKKRALGKLAALFFAVLLFCHTSFFVKAEGAGTEQTVEERVAEMLAEEHVPGEMLVRFDGSVSTENALEILQNLVGGNGEISQRSFKAEWGPDFPESFLVATEEENLYDLLVRLNSHSKVIVAIPNF